MATLAKSNFTILKLFNNRSTHLKKSLRPYFIQVIAELTMQGFSIKQALQFLKILLPRHADIIQIVLEDLQKGSSLEHGLAKIGFSQQICAQIFFSQKQGRFNQALFDIANQLKTLQKYQSRLTKLMIYPMLLILFLFCLLFGMREFMLAQIISFIEPELFQTNLMVKILILFFTFLPQIILGLLAFCLFLYLISDFYLHRLDTIERYRLLIKIPFLKKNIRHYCSYRFAKEIAYFLEGGFSIQQTLDILIKYPHDPFLEGIARELQTNYLQGIPLETSLKELDLFNTSLVVVIYQGEITSQTAHKCKIYSQKIFDDLLEDLSKKIHLIQPILFILIASLIMAMYLILMLPMLTMEI